MYRNIKKIMFFTLALLVILQLPTFNREVKAKNNELQLSELTIIENQQNNSHYKFALGWKILGRVEEGDYFYLDIKGQESDKIPEEFLSQDGVRGVHMGNGRYKFTMPASYDKKKNVEGGFGAEFNLSRGGSVLQVSSSGLSQYLSLDHVKTGGSYTDDEVYSKGLMKNIYLKDGAYYIDWYVRLGSRGKNVYRFAMTDSLGEGHSLVKESVKVSFGGEMAYPISQSNKTGVSLDNLGLSDKTISFVLANNNTYKGQERVTIFYTSKIDDINREVYLNNLYLSKDGKTIANVTKEATWSSYAWSKAELDENFSKVVIKKMDKMNERPLEGAIFNIFDGEGRLIKSNLQTDSRGEISHYLIEGDYRLIEISAPEGYEIDQPAIEFSISADDIGKDKIIKVYNSKEKSLDDIKTEEEIKETIVEDHDDWVNSEKDYDKALEDYYTNKEKEEALEKDHEDWVNSEKDYDKALEDYYANKEKEEALEKDHEDWVNSEKDYDKALEDYYANKEKEEALEKDHEDWVNSEKDYDKALEDYYANKEKEEALEKDHDDWVNSEKDYDKALEDYYTNKEKEEALEKDHEDWVNLEKDYDKAIEDYYADKEKEDALEKDHEDWVNSEKDYDKALEDYYANKEKEEALEKDHEDWVNSEKDYDKALEDYYANKEKEDDIVEDHEDWVNSEKDYDKALEDYYADKEKEEALEKDHEDWVNSEKDYDKAIEDYYANKEKEDAIEKDHEDWVNSEKDYDKALEDYYADKEKEEALEKDHEDWVNSEKDYDKALEDYYANEAKKEDQEKPVEDKKDDQEQEEPITKEDKDQTGLEKDQEKPVEDKKDDHPGEDSGISIAPVQPETPELIEPLEPETPCLDEEKEKEEDDDSGVLGFIKIPEEKEDEDSAVLGIKNESHKTRPENDKDQDKKMSPAPQTGDGGVEIYSLLALLSILMVVSIRQKKIKE